MLPTFLKKSNYTPYKKKNLHKATSYRPLALLPCMGKIYEVIIAKRMEEFTTEKNILIENNSDLGIRKTQRCKSPGYQTKLKLAST